MVILSLFSHFLADFVFQSKRLTEKKKERIIIGNLFHSLIVLITYLLIFIIFVLYSNQYFSIELFFIILFISVIHLLIDITKSLVVKIGRNNAKLDLFMFLLDQLIHVISIIIICYTCNNNFLLNTYLEAILVIICIYLAVIYIGDFTIRKTFKAIKLLSYEKREEDIKGVGSHIGKIERTIILTMLIFGHPEVAIAVIGIKSIARFPEMNNDKGDKNNDYFILGNLLSLLIVIIGYVLYLLKDNGFYHIFD